VFPHCNFLAIKISGGIAVLGEKLFGEGSFPRLARSKNKQYLPGADGFRNLVLYFTLEYQHIFKENDFPLIQSPFALFSILAMQGMENKDKKSVALPLRRHFPSPKRKLPLGAVFFL
jgi:hypothetical protein